MHHVCGEHVWVDGECDHSYMEPGSVGDVSKQVLVQGSVPYLALKAIVEDKKLLSKLPMCVRF
jgi:hypothetical protein